MTIENENQDPITETVDEIKDNETNKATETETEKEQKTFTQEEVNDIISKRLKREKTKDVDTDDENDLEELKNKLNQVENELKTTKLGKVVDKKIQESGFTLTEEEKLKFLGEDEESTIKNIESFVEMFNRNSEITLDKKINESKPKPSNISGSQSKRSIDDIKKIKNKKERFEAMAELLNNK